MILKVAKHMGYCAGVRRAIAGAYNAPAGTCVLGEIIHNGVVVEQLKRCGIKTVESVDEIDSDRVIIRSHGVGDDVYVACAKKNIRILDYTCPFVSKTHDIVRQHYKNGFQIVIVGKHNHPEVVGINGCCDYRATVISTFADCESFVPSKKVCVVAQTTFNAEEFRKICEILCKHAVKELEILETICYTTLERQKEAESLAQECDAMLILGSPKSSNTNQLFRISKHFCASSYLISEVGQLENILFKDDDCVGITSGASTHDELIQEVLQFYERKQ